MLRQIRFNHGHLEFASKINHEIARHAFENARVQWRRDQRRLVAHRRRHVANDEQIVARAFRHQAHVIEHHRFRHARVNRFDLCENVVEVIHALDARRKRSRVHADRRCGDDRHALGVKFLRVKRDRISDDENAGPFAVVGV